MKPNKIRSFDELRTYLTTFSTWDGDHIHDFGGAFILLGALLDNIREYSLGVDLERVGEYLTEEQRTFLCRLAELAKNANGA